MLRSTARLAALCLFAGLLVACTARRESNPVIGEAAQPSEASSTGSGPGTVTGSIQVRGVTRTYRLYVPASLQPDAPAALVVALHGGGGSGGQMEASTGLDSVAEHEGFLVAYPNGSGRLVNSLLTWNAGNCCGYALDEEVDDVEFIRSLVEDLSSAYAIDSRRVYATGMSNGGMMTYRLACEAAGIFAAVAPVAGALNLEPCEPVEPVSLLAIHGTDDQHVLYEGGVPVVSMDSHARVDHSVHYALAFWALHDGCLPEPQIEQAGAVIHETYTDCPQGLGVELLAIQGGGHAWPGGIVFRSAGDKPSQDLVASEALWAFFEAHPRP